jgi:hypothetical protein
MENQATLFLLLQMSMVCWGVLLASLGSTPYGRAGVEGALFDTGLVGAAHLQDLSIIQYNPLRG